MVVCVYYVGFVHFPTIIVCCGVVCSCQSAFVGIAEYVWEGGTGCCGSGSSKTYSSICIRRWQRFFLDSCWSSVHGGIDFYDNSEHDVTTAKHTAQTTAWLVRLLYFCKHLMEYSVLTWLGYLVIYTKTLIFYLVYLRIIQHYWWWKICVLCVDAVGWVAGRACDR